MNHPSRARAQFANAKNASYYVPGGALDSQVPDDEWLDQLLCEASSSATNSIKEASSVGETNLVGEGDPEVSTITASAKQGTPSKGKCEKCAVLQLQVTSERRAKDAALARLAVVEARLLVLEGQNGVNGNGKRSRTDSGANSTPTSECGEVEFFVPEILDDSTVATEGRTSPPTLRAALVSSEEEAVVAVEKPRGPVYSDRFPNLYLTPSPLALNSPLPSHSQEPLGAGLDETTSMVDAESQLAETQLSSHDDRREGTHLRLPEYRGYSPLDETHWFLDTVRRAREHFTAPNGSCSLSDDIIESAIRAKFLAVHGWEPCTDHPACM
ncbi:unnamed protein product [Peniophora sp. CBMAI 1063]|nr:unnamed protein product [Peniophora sp. CBMAI 1063]